MELAKETLITAQGWSQFDKADNTEVKQERLNFAHKVAKVFGTKEGKEVLGAMVQRYLLASFNGDNEHSSLLRKHGRADVVKAILSDIEASANS